MEQGIERCARLVEQLLMLSKIEKTQRYRLREEKNRLASSGGDRHRRASAADGEKKAAVSM